ncbi:SDR family oxidoreductase [Pseudohalocynthiibacter aestuariivivens]|uniref:SDR family oxidoreductase n=1 Tax=Roseovarius pelagicus TaxID=2980108 RepID=A0ABY6DFI3_9RHOB|nr:MULTISPECIES: SDR family oxidoreductase [Rhodobacterales]QIE47179.1 SDR family oxidoreductase [Pseudohalocynthiibacter aestuariivivens]UXX84270.1 SDR family oxidoreductase [Roseovarius pelagicus]
MPGLDLTGADWLMVGASGRVGRMVRRAWVDDPDVAIRLVPQLRSGTVATTDRVLYWAPLDGPEPFERYVRYDGTPAALIMLAGVIPGPDADFSTNVGLAVACLEAAKAAGCERVLIASSVAVYDHSSDMPLTEDAPCNPSTLYGASKLAMEQACVPYRDQGMDVCCLRIGNVVGADALMRNAEAGGDLRIDRFPAGQGPSRPYIGPESLARIVSTLASWPECLPETLNVAAPGGSDMSALADAAGLNWDWAVAPRDAVQHISVDTSRLSQFYTFEPEECAPEGMIAQLRKVGSGI